MGDSKLCILVVVGFLLAAPCAEATPLDTGFYTTYDDASWAVVTSNLTTPSKQVIYDAFMKGCRDACYDDDKDEEFTSERARRLCDSTEQQRLHMNMYQPRSVR
jgi:hypothetical protein